MSKTLRVGADHDLEVVDFLASNGFTNVSEIEVIPENVRFGLPPEIVKAIGTAPGASPGAV